ncbi:MAG: hypothetical protein IT364_26460, partial [Candidatus Hydrogenedentes bacterium]|nr:hypothetical protein [Candidatus Hydrogenedentota bacterium]
MEPLSLPETIPIADCTEPLAEPEGDGASESVYGTGKSNWSQVGPASPHASQLDSEAAETLNALGYLDGYEPPVSAATGVVFADTRRCFGGYRLYVSGHKPEAALISADGALAHSWSIPFSMAFPDVPPEETYASRFRRAYVYPNGDLLAIFDLAGLVRLGVDSSIKWVHPGASHHDFDVQPDGSIYVIDSAIESVPEQENAIIGYITRLT